MKSIKNIFISLLIVIFAINIFAMNMVDVTDTEKQPKKQYFIYEQGTDNGIWIDEDVIIWIDKEGKVHDNSHVIRSMLEDTDSELEKIPLNFPIDTIKLAFNVLKEKIKNITKLSLEQIIDIANLFNYLEVPSEKLATVLAIIKKDIDTNQNFEALKKLHPDLQKLTLTQPTINCLKDLIIEKYINDRKTSLDGHSIDVRAIAFHPDGKQFASGSLGLAPDNLILWNITDPKNITHQTFTGPQTDVVSIAFSPDGTKIATGCYGDQNNLIVWDISDPKNITHHALDGHPRAVFAIAFSRDSTQLISGCAGNQNNLIIWDISNLTNITHNAIEGCPDTVYSVAFHPTDNNQFISGGEGNENNLIVWNKSDLNNITYQTIEGCSSTVHSVAYNSNGAEILSGSEGGSSELPAHSNLILRDIKDFDNFELLIGHPDTVETATFNATDTKIASGCRGKKDNLIIWKNIKDLDKITHQVLNGHADGVFAVQFSSDNKYMVSGGSGFKDNLLFWTFITDQEEQLLNDCRNYNADQIRFLYELCQKQSTAFEENSDKYKMFKSLPQEMQDLCNNVFIKSSGENLGWLSSLWRAIQRKM